SRGMDPVNEDTLCELLVKTSQLIERCQFQEIDLNPVICVHNQCLIADARIILRGQ
ncbi:MAG TPA: acetyl-CoA synthetase, partial [Deltaproteobacteria bacterium]|nr:acetyl-CoA synthetase [Deltaproteobacteria bacterium]